jgi:tetratricopeptide (TPR) repeat protein
MLTRITLLLAATLVALPARADYVRDREAAAKLLQQRKYEPALKAFEKLAGSATSDAQKSDAYEQAAKAALELKKPDLAMALAEKIPIEGHAHAVQLHILYRTGRHQQAIDQFKDADISAWPAVVRGMAHYDRGRAVLALKKPATNPAEDPLLKLAVADLTAALEHIDSNNEYPRACGTLADALARSGDTAKAIEACRMAYPTDKRRTNVNKAMSAAIRAAKLLAGQGDHTAAIREIEQLESGKQEARLVLSWRAQAAWTKADIHIASGDRDAARACYKKLLETKGLTTRHIELTQKKLGAIGGD